MTTFVDRADELERLHTLYDSDEFEFAVVYGRRRIGKTELVLESLREREGAVYHQATQTTPATQLDRFVDDATTVVPGIEDVKREWDALLRHLLGTDAIVVIDEFPYLVDTTPSLPSEIQRIVDHDVADSSATLVLTGSSIGMVHEHVLDGGAPLYGRLSQTPSGRIELTQLPFDAAMEFVPDYDDEQQVFTFGIFGGTPRYLRPIDDDLTVGENVARTLLAPEGPLHDEPETVLQMELDEVNRYFSLLESMARGNRERNEIAQGAGLQSRDTSYYFDRLETLDLIERHHPVTVDPTRTRRTRFRIRDPLFRFWFRFIYGQAGRYELYGEDAYADLVAPELPDFVSDTFEQLCRAALPGLYPNDDPTRVPGAWWYDGREIDVVAPTSDGTLLVGECKFTSQPVGYDILARLEDDTAHVDWTPPTGGDPEYSYALFARNGFTRSVREAAAERSDLALFDLTDVVDALHRSSPA
ncbi:ATPase (AAA+ superfamily) [Halalkaliarchaeum desulfuricum]|uniref:ATPase (AAA+ superfamily) n=1 Tax=Halalkaliarchaeum desulfuricum TaxID=2055893 RepID=A0A343TN51_9EURY|nr:ATP-binding protein [Halalkaliarchaeum desulfuricum]AUX10523.1 ATPase (AAA+ superfamily) [Halalkaliarchaeum desulfuricum]